MNFLPFTEYFLSLSLSLSNLIKESPISLWPFPSTYIPASDSFIILFNSSDLPYANTGKLHARYSNVFVGIAERKPSLSSRGTMPTSDLDKIDGISSLGTGLKK